MKLLDADKALVRQIGGNLRAMQARDTTVMALGGYEQVGDGDGADFSVTVDVPSVRVTKEDLREQSARKHIRTSYQEAVVAELNREVGVAATLQDGVIYARSVPQVDMTQNTLTLQELKKNGGKARRDLADD